MHRKYQEHSLSLNVDLQSQFDLVPTELVQLINFYQNVDDLNNNGYSKEALAISQTIMYNFTTIWKKKYIFILTTQQKYSISIPIVCCC